MKKYKITSCVALTHPGLLPVQYFMCDIWNTTHWQTEHIHLFSHSFHRSIKKAITPCSEHLAYTFSDVRVHKCYSNSLLHLHWFCSVWKANLVLFKSSRERLGVCLIFAENSCCGAKSTQQTDSTICSKWIVNSDKIKVTALRNVNKLGI